MVYGSPKLVMMFALVLGLGCGGVGPSADAGPPADLPLMDTEEVADIADAPSILDQIGGDEGGKPDLPTEGALQLAAPDIVSPGACMPMELVLLGGGGDPEPAQNTHSIALEVLGGAAFGSADCSDPIPSIDIPSGQSGVSFSVRAENGPECRVGASTAGKTPDEVLVQVSNDGYGQDERPAQTLVVYNQNAEAALEIAEYYANKRGIAATHLCPVGLPRGLYATGDELLAARRIIVEDCICALIPEEQRPDPCGVTTLSEVIEVSPINHISLIRGIPARLTGTIWPSDYWDPSFDFYLSFLLANEVEIFAQSQGGVQNLSYPILTSVKRYLPPLLPLEHRFVANGRVEAITVARTLDLIDRTLASEGAGFQGNILTERAVDPDRLDQTPGRYFTSSFSSACNDYLSYEPFVFEAAESSWDPGTCRWGSTGSTAPGSEKGMMPGSNNTTVSYPLNVGLFLGTEPRADEQPTNGQAGFNKHSTMLRWRKSSTTCLPLCADFDLASEVDDCVEKSKDFFKQINTDCVGAAPGFMGQQVRSFPVQFYGFIPPSWSVAGGGDQDKTPPVVFAEGGFQDETFTDGYFAHFGAADPLNLNGDTCLDTSLQAVSCPERLAVNLSKRQVLGESLLIEEERPLRVRFRYRNQGHPDAFLDLRLCLNACDNEGVRDLRDGEGKLPAIDLQEDHLEWTEADFTVYATTEQAAEVEKFKLWFDGRLHKKIRGFFDLDAISVVDVLTGAELATSSGWSFERTKRTSNTSGAAASDAMDRVGGIAFWGSSSHHLTGGWAWKQLWNVAGALFQGRTLGESLTMASAKSGIIYGDPLYRAYGVKIWNPENEAMVPPFNKLVLSTVEAMETPLLISVLQGTNHTDTVRWSLARCVYEDPVHCEAEDWQSLKSGIGAVRAHPIPLTDLSEIQSDTGWTLRLRAWRPDQPENHLSAYGRFEILDP